MQDTNNREILEQGEKVTYSNSLCYLLNFL